MKRRNFKNNISSNSVIQEYSENRSLNLYGAGNKIKSDIKSVCSSQLSLQNSLLPYKGILFGIQTKYVSARRNEQYFTVLLKHMQIHIRATFS